MKTVRIALAIIVNETRARTVVGTRAENIHLAGMSEFPGGKIEAGETPRDAAIREALEETGLTVEVIEEWPVIEFEYPERTVTLHPFLCVGNESVTLRGPWQWLRIWDIDRVNFPEANLSLIERLKRLV